MRWHEWRWRLPRRQGRCCAQALTALGYLQHALSSGSRADVELAVYAARGRLPPAVRALLAGLGPPRAQAVHEEGTWFAALSKQQAQEIAPGIWIDPTGRQRLPPRAVRLHLPPLPAFGDGQHPTTRLLARWLAASDLGGQRVLDLGCGTGILGLIARLRGARRVDFADADPHAVRACRQACRLNGYPGARVWRGDLLAAVPPDRSCDLLVANLYADLVLRLLADPRLPSCTGRLWLSGIARRAAGGVRRALRRAGFQIVKEEDADDWWIGIAAERRA
ncbi:MAG: 50S ribosomal protein L11 methyltransferase [Planctomycetota bacterium]|nr:50S ribosomal protein L11 methyltransferase [Planctomycetota bacterium]